MPTRGPLALRQVTRFVPRSAPALIELISLKRSNLIFRRTRYAGIVVDEGFMTQIFPWVPRAPTLQVFILLGGQLRIEARDGSSRREMRPGDAVLLSPADASLARYEDVDLIDLEWDPDAPIEGPPVRPLEPVDLGRATALAERLREGAAPDAEILNDALELFRSAAAPLGRLSIDARVGGPSERDIRIASAIGAQIADLRNTATAPFFGVRAELSPRQIQRVLADFCERYRMNATSWRDMRNRYRLQFAIGLASIPDISVTTLADEVGYTSATALARAFANAGLPPPSELRDRLRERR